MKFMATIIGQNFWGLAKKWKLILWTVSCQEDQTKQNIVPAFNPRCLETYRLLAQQNVWEVRSWVRILAVTVDIWTFLPFLDIYEQFSKDDR